MVFLRRILVTTDLSQHSLEAMEYASSFGLLYSSHIFLLHVAEGGKGKDEGLEVLSGFAAEHLSPEQRVTLVVRVGSAAEEIVRFALEEAIDLIVIGQDRRTRYRSSSRWRVGSVGQKVVRLANSPVLTVKPTPVRERILWKEDVERELHLR